MSWIDEFENRMLDWDKNGGKTNWSCPCGFSGGARNICAHRHTCLGWRLYVAWVRWVWDQKEGEKKGSARTTLRPQCDLCQDPANALVFVACGCTCFTNEYQRRCRQHLRRLDDTDEYEIMETYPTTEEDQA